MTSSHKQLVKRGLKKAIKCKICSKVIDRLSGIRYDDNKKIICIKCKNFLSLKIPKIPKIRTSICKTCGKSFEYDNKYPKKYCSLPCRPSYYIPKIKTIERENIQKKPIRHFLKPWQDPDSLFCDTEFLKKFLGKDPLKGDECREKEKNDR